MEKIYCLIGAFLMLMMPIFSTSIVANPEPELNIGIFGASLFGGLRRVGFIIYNYGEETVYDIEWTFTVTGESDDSIDVYHTDIVEELGFNWAHQFSTPEITGSGPVTLTLTVNSENAEEVTKTIQGYQLGPFTLSKTWNQAWRDLP